jgi:hypothetical protein
LITASLVCFQPGIERRGVERDHAAFRIGGVVVLIASVEPDQAEAPGRRLEHRDEAVLDFRLVAMGLHRARPGLAVILGVGEENVIALSLQVRRDVPVGDERAVAHAHHRRHVRVAQKPIASGSHLPHIGPSRWRPLRELERRGLVGLLDPAEEHAGF